MEVKQEEYNKNNDRALGEIQKGRIMSECCRIFMSFSL